MTASSVTTAQMRWSALRKEALLSTAAAPEATQGRDESSQLAPVEFLVSKPPRVVCALFACPSCNWPLFGAKFTSFTAAESHEEVFELACGGCRWSGAVLGAHAVRKIVEDWSGREIRHHVEYV